ncbi:chromosome partitioning protein [Lachnospiraceae bacterium PM6-15]|uniref:ParA family protein n=1 Tax=Ohessyouella blattaphilus TaxID=2949333 RepID=A0ABT1EF79_9FIRM|nr:ParA family protein [Ohessyouella blattaphilus]MCP1109144.1 ParA family protein [Ohessyouella blattaphilus]MCR8562538.1 ParA family protein [Ohessyouella blattaphilus]MDL2250246.1 ParA family protein [Lachnospiraceae bacterium OttesenSCG-928-J05]
MAKVIVLTNQKGGVGKTTSSAALVVGLKKSGERVLAIDLDPQGNLGFSLGVNIEEGYTMYEVLKGDISLQEAIRHTEYYGDVITSNILLSEMELSLKGEERNLILKNMLDEVADNYDFIVIDTPPALNILTLNAYTAADELIIPMAAEILSLVGLMQLKETIQGVQDSLNPELRVLGILMTKYFKQTNLSKDVLEMVKTVAEKIGTEVFDTKISNSVVVAEAPAHGVSIFDYSPKSKPAYDYQLFVAETMEKICN